MGVALCTGLAVSRSFAANRLGRYKTGLRASASVSRNRPTLAAVDTRKERKAGMTGTRLLILAIAAMAPLAAACDDDEGPSDDATQFSAQLIGEEEVPPVPTPASGTAT